MQLMPGRRVRASIETARSSLWEGKQQMLLSAEWSEHRRSNDDSSVDDDDDDEGDRGEGDEGEFIKKHVVLDDLTVDSRDSFCNRSTMKNDAE